MPQSLNNVCGLSLDWLHYIHSSPLLRSYNGAQYSSCVLPVLSVEDHHLSQTDGNALPNAVLNAFVCLCHKAGSWSACHQPDRAVFQRVSMNWSMNQVFLEHIPVHMQMLWMNGNSQHKLQ